MIRTHLYIIFITFVLCNRSILLLSTTAYTCTMEDMVGTQSEEICKLRDVLKIYTSKKSEGPSGTFLFYGPQGTGKSSTAKKIAKETGTELIIISVENETKYEKIDKLLDKAIELAKNKKQVIVLIQNVDKMTDRMVKLTIHTFLNRDVQKIKNITAILTASDPRKYDDVGEKQFMDWVRFKLPNLAERKQFINNYLKNRQRLLSKTQISFIALTTRNFSCGDLEEFLMNANYFTVTKDFFPLLRGYFGQIIKNRELRNSYISDIAISVAGVAAIYYFRHNITNLGTKLVNTYKFEDEK